MTGGNGPNPEPWWMALDRHREHESGERHSAMRELQDRLDDLELWRAELRGALSLVRILIGSNVLLALVTLAALATAWKG